MLQIVSLNNKNISNVMHDLHNKLEHVVVVEKKSKLMAV